MYYFNANKCNADAITRRYLNATILGKPFTEKDIEEYKNCTLKKEWFDNILVAFDANKISYDTSREVWGDECHGEIPFGDRAKCLEMTNHKRDKVTLLCSSEWLSPLVFSARKYLSHCVKNGLDPNAVENQWAKEIDGNIVYLDREGNLYCINNVTGIFIPQSFLVDERAYTVVLCDFEPIDDKFIKSLKNETPEKKTVKKPCRKDIVLFNLIDLILKATWLDLDEIQEECGLSDEDIKKYKSFYGIV